MVSVLSGMTPRRVSGPVEDQRQRARRAVEDALERLDLARVRRKPDVRQTREQRLEGAAPHHPRQRRTEAEVDALAEREVLLGVLPPHVEGAGLGKVRLVAV